MDLSNHFAIMVKIVPLVRTSLNTDGHQSDFACTVDLIRSIVFIPDTHIHLTSGVLHLECSLLIPFGFLTTTVNGLRLELLSVKFENSKWILASEHVKVTFECCFNDVQLNRSASSRLLLGFLLFIIVISAKINSLNWLLW